MGKSKAKTMAELNDGGFVARQSILFIKTQEEAHRREAREARLVEERKVWEHKHAEYLAREKERIAAAAELLKAHEKRLRQKQDEYDKPLPLFKPQILEEVKRQFFGYVGRVVNDAVFSIHEDWHINDELARFKKIPAQSLGAALRLSQLNIGRISVILFLHVDLSLCDGEQRAIFKTKIFRNKVVYRIQGNLFKNIPYFSEFDPTQKAGNPNLQIDSFRVSLWHEPDFSLLKKIGFTYPQEEKVIHLEIF